MKRLWPGCLLCALAAILFVYMAAIEAPGISAQIGGMELPDAVVTGYDLDGALALHTAFKLQQAEAEASGEQSASAAYISMHQGSDLLFPPMLAASLMFLAFAGLRDTNLDVPPRLARIGLGTTFAVAAAYQGFDYAENAVADAMFGPSSIRTDLNAELVPVLRGLTFGKYSPLCLHSFWSRRSGRAAGSAGAPGSRRPFETCLHELHPVARSENDYWFDLPKAVAPPTKPAGSSVQTVKRHDHIHRNLLAFDGPGTLDLRDLSGGLAAPGRGDQGGQGQGLGFQVSFC